jgi:hypothetical protein
MANGFRQQTPEQRERDRIAMDKAAGTHVETDFCDGCGATFIPSWANTPGACSRCSPGYGAESGHMLQ